MRADTLKKLTFDMFKSGVDEQGREWIQAHIGSMKNLPGDLEHLDAAIFKQRVLSHEDPRCLPNHNYFLICFSIQSVCRASIPETMQVA